MASSPLEQIVDHLEEDLVPLGKYTISKQGKGKSFRVTYPKTAIRAGDLDPGDPVEAFLHHSGALVLVPNNAPEEGH